MRRCRRCRKPLPPGGNMFFCDYICAIRFGKSSKSGNLSFSEVSRLMKAIVTLKVDEKIILDRCQHCDGECKILVTEWEKGFTIYCEGYGLRARARELGISLIEVTIGGPGAVEAFI